MTLSQIEARCAGDPRWAPHARRYHVSLEAVAAAYTGGRIVDVGAASPFTEFLATVTPHVQATGDAELRVVGPLPGCRGDSVSMVTCLEVLEHLKDGAADDRGTWSGSGVRAVLRAIWHTLERGGRLLVSTPNVTSLAALRHWLAGAHPFLYAPHPRELAPPDLRACLDETGYRVERIWTVDVWRHVSPTERRHLRALVAAAGGSPALRGDCLFAWAVKP